MRLGVRLKLRGAGFHHNEGTISYAHKIWVFSSDTHTIEPSKDAAFSYTNPSDPSLASTNKFRLSSPNSSYDGNPLVSHAIGLHGESWLNVTHVAASQRPALMIIDNYDKNHNSIQHTEDIYKDRSSDLCFKFDTDMIEKNNIHRLFTICLFSKKSVKRNINAPSNRLF